MKAEQAEIDSQYIMQTGTLATVFGEKDGKILLKLATSGTIIRVSDAYELKPIGIPKHIPETAKKTTQNGKYGAQKTLSLAAIIDPMLLAGGYTVKEIAAELGRQAGETTAGKDLEANVRARLVSYTRKGWQILKQDKQVKAVKI